MIYSHDDIACTYEKVHDLLLTRYIIKTYSTNKTDVRDIALKGLNLSKVTNVLELGCGYGFFIEKLKGLLHSDAVVSGIDIVPHNKEPFINSVASVKYRGKFIDGPADQICAMSDCRFDLIISSYSLYFFKHLIPDISRILTTKGIFIALTHSDAALQEALQHLPDCLQEAGMENKGDLALTKLFQSFSLENGQEQLAGHFETVERIFYNNMMIFPRDKIEDCMFYLNKKNNLIYKEVIESDPDKVPLVSDCLQVKMMKNSIDSGYIRLNKNDGIFRCSKPKNNQEMK